MSVPYIPYGTVNPFYTLQQAAEAFHTTIPVVQEKSKQYAIKITCNRAGVPGLDKERFIQLHRYLYHEHSGRYKRIIPR